VRYETSGSVGVQPQHVIEEHTYEKTKKGREFHRERPKNPCTKCWGPNVAYRKDLVTGKQNGMRDFPNNYQAGENPEKETYSFRVDLVCAKKTGGGSRTAGGHQKRGFLLIMN